MIFQLPNPIVKYVVPYPIHHGDNISILKKLIADGVRVDSIVTDGPYGLRPSKNAKVGFMGATWDYDVPSVEFWKLCLEILEPGGQVLSFGGTRTYHRMVVNLEDAGFEIRDQLVWLYGQGFPKSRNISLDMDKAAGAEREVIGMKKGVKSTTNLNVLARPDGKNDPDAKACGAYGTGVKQHPVDLSMTAAATPQAQRWDGWGTALKPAMEPIVLARKPLSEKSVAANVLKWGTGAINIDDTRIAGVKPATTRGAGGQHGRYGPINAQGRIEDDGKGRWPSNVILDEQAGELLGDAARFFYCAKASKAERRGSSHTTIKPIALMRYLCRLITPPKGWILDPFAGSGTTGEAALLEGFYPVLIEQDTAYIEDIRRRIDAIEDVG